MEWRAGKLCSSPILILILFSIVLAFFVFVQPFRFFSLPGIQPLVDFKISQQSLLFDNEAEPESVQLPDDWALHQRSDVEYWYRSLFFLSSIEDDIWAVYLPNVTHNVAVYINGIWVGRGGKFSDPVSRHHNEPILFSFSPELLVPDVNSIDIRVKAAVAQQGYLGNVYLAPRDQLADHYEWKHTVRYRLIHWVTALVFFISFFLLMLWLVRPKESIYGIFSASVFIWAVHNLNLVVNNISMPSKTWEALIVITLGWMVCGIVFFNHRYTNEKHPMVERILLIYCLTGIALFFLPTHDLVLFYGYEIWYAFLIPIGLYALAQLYSVYSRNKSKEILLMLYAGVVILTFGVHDIMVINHWWDRSDGLIIQYSIIPAILVFSWFLIKRFSNSLNTAELLAVTLEERVQQREKQLSDQFSELRLLEKNKLLSEERERMMRDMHDGIGGQLISLSTMFQDKADPVCKEALNRVKGCIMDLRLVIDSLDPSISDLATLLGTLRVRLDEQMSSARLSLDWQVDDLPASGEMTSQTNLHILRIIQEAITNVIKHSGSTRVTLRARRTSEGFALIEVIDDGVGIEENCSQQGRGLKNMHYRAQQIGAQLVIEKTGNGTNVRLTLY